MGYVSVLDNHKHEKMARALVETQGDKAAAYQKAYPNSSKRSAITRSKVVLDAHPEIRSRAAQIAENAGLTGEYLGKKLFDLTNANDFQWHKDGKVHKTPDHKVQLSAVQTALKLHNFLDTSSQVDNRQLNVNLSSINPKKLDKIVGKLQDLGESLLNDTSQTGEVEDITDIRPT